MEFLDISSIEGSQNSMYNSVEDHGREILILNIDIGGGKTDEIIIREHDTPKFIAKEFCRRHKLNPEAEKVLIDVIKQHIHVKPTVEVSMMAEQKSKNEEGSKIFSIEMTHEEPQQKKSETLQEAEILKQSKSFHRPNYGERLYTVGLINKEKHEKKIKDIREKLNQEKMKDATFKPSITPDKKMPRLNLLQSNSPPKTLDRCQMLYNKSQKPTNVSSPPSKAINNSPNTSQKVINSRKNLQHYLEQRELSQGRPRRSKSPAVHTRENSRKNCRSQSHELKVKLSNEQTDKILARIKTIRFIQLFEILNPNEKQEIDKHTINHSRLPRLIANILKPFLDELKILNYGLNLDQFCKVMELYIKELTPEERTALLQIGKKSVYLHKNMMLNRDFVNDLWSPKHEEKLLAFDHFPDNAEKIEFN